MAFFRNQRQFQQLAFVAVVVAPVVAAIENTTLSSQVFFTGRFQYQSHTEPALPQPTPLPFIGTTTAQPAVTHKFIYQSLAQPVPIVSETITEDKWYQPWSERLQTRRLPTSEHPFFTYTSFTPEVVTTDKWIYPWSEPVRQKIGLKTHLQQTFIAPVLDNETQIIQNFESRWHYPWSEPVRFRTLSTAQRQAQVQGPLVVPLDIDQWLYPWSQPVRTRPIIQVGSNRLYSAPVFVSEVITADKWAYPWSEPVRQKPGLMASLQQAAIGPVLDSETQILNTFESRWHFPWYEPVRIRPQLIAALQQAQIQGPVQTVEFITVDKWIYPWTDPVRQKIGLATQLQQAFIAPVLDDETQIIQGFESRWHYAWSEPVRIRPQVPAAEQQVYTAPPTEVFETITVDKWIYPWTDPVRQKIGLKVHLQQAFIAPVLDDETQLIQGFESRWHFPWSEPVRLRPQLPAGEQQAIQQGPIQTPEFITVDKWIYAWSEPVRQKIGLKTHLQQAFIAPVLDDETQIIQTFESRWHYAWSEPVRFRQLSTAQQQTLAQQEPSFEVLTFDKWGFAWSEPVRQKPGLKTHLQQSLIATILDDETQIIQTYESRWHFAWSEPVRIKRQLPAGEQQTQVQGPLQTLELITVDKWIYPWSEPVRQKIGLKINLQQALIAPVLVDDQITGTIEARWHEPWSEPVRFRRFPTAEQQSQVQGPIQTPELITVDKWIYGWSDPVRQKIGLRASLQQSFIAPVLADEQLTGTIESRWHEPWSEPVRFRTLAVAQQQSAAAPATSVFETITVDKWIYPFTNPVRQKLGLGAGLQQAFIGLTLEPNTQIIQTYESRWHQAWSEPVRQRIGLKPNLQQSIIQTAVPPVEIVTVDKWFGLLGEPVRLKIGLRASLQQAFIAPINRDDVITGKIEARWHQPWSEPLRKKPGLGAWLQRVTTPETPIFPTGIVRLNQWFAPLNEPVRLKLGLRAGLQRFFQTSHEVVLPDVFVTLSATETNTDSASFGITVYNAVPVVSRVPTTVVSIKEIPATRKADVSIEEAPAIDKASVSIEET